MSATVHYPLSAVVAADELKLALCLAAVDPAIGGVLIEGPRGMAKSTLARGVAELLPAGEFVTLPLGASEERIVGSLDLDAALGEGRARFSPGVLAKADGGVLYVDEVNLLPDHLVDLLLDVAASGVNLVERDGISHRHPARFVLIGTMNPEEGELRPQLLDRFGLNVRLDTQPPPAERAEIIRRRLAFDADPQAFVERWEGQQDTLRRRCAEARRRLARIPLDDAALDSIARRCSRRPIGSVSAWPCCTPPGSRRNGSGRGRRPRGSCRTGCASWAPAAVRRCSTPCTRPLAGWRADSGRNPPSISVCWCLPTAVCATGRRCRRLPARACWSTSKAARCAWARPSAWPGNWGPSIGISAN